MLNEYPITAAHAFLELHRVTERIDSLTRINNEPRQGKQSTMQNNLATLEAHMQYVTTKQLQDAYAHEQLRIARANRPGTMRTLITKARLSIGTMLVSIGERLQAGHDALEAEQLRKTRTRTA